MVARKVGESGAAWRKPYVTTDDDDSKSGLEIKPLPSEVKLHPGRQHLLCVWRAWRGLCPQRRRTCRWRMVVSVGLSGDLWRSRQYSYQAAGFPISVKAGASPYCLTSQSGLSKWPSWVFWQMWCLNLILRPSPIWCWIDAEWCHLFYQEAHGLWGTSPKPPSRRVVWQTFCAAPPVVAPHTLRLPWASSAPGTSKSVSPFDSGCRSEYSATSPLGLENSAPRPPRRHTW